MEGSEFGAFLSGHRDIPTSARSRHRHGQSRSVAPCGWPAHYRRHV